MPGVLFLIAGVFAMMLPSSTRAQSKANEVTKIEIPESIRHEHHQIHSTLVEATKAPGRVGTAAKTLAQALDPHFKREEEIALPPLGLLAPLSAGASVSDAVRSEALRMADALRRELPGMLEEHKRIRAAVDGLRQAAVAEQAVKFQQLADQLAHHAQTEEEVLYPTAILVGDVIRARQAAK
jgi:iron-sulfur cluster repair protein YtfE (RIC family)